jgi:enoyl-CoA hydratase/carnithine racemase
MVMEAGTIHSTVEDGIGWLVVDYAARRNALTRAMMGQLSDAATKLDSDPAVRVLVIRGAGDKAFISGGDISQFSEMQDSENVAAAMKDVGTTLFETLGSLNKPLIAMINGHCLGGGMMVAIEADLRIASDKATFGIPAARLGVGYPYEAVKRVADRVGPANAAEILLIGGRLDADRALAMGLVNKVTSAAQLEAECREIARAICANAPLTLRTIKLALREYLKNPGASQNADVARLADICAHSQDFREGSAAFMEKRPPQFRGE